MLTRNKRNAVAIRYTTLFCPVSTNHRIPKKEIRFLLARHLVQDHALSRARSHTFRVDRFSYIRTQNKKLAA